MATATYQSNLTDTGEDIENISYPALIGLLKEMYGKIEQLEQRLDDLEPPPTWAK